MAAGVEYRIFGPPGTGKTTYLARQIENAVRAHGADAVMVASFTRAAASELAGRDLPLPKHAVGTLHAHCYRALNMPKVAESLIDEFNKAHPELKLTPDMKASLEDQATEVQAGTHGDRLFMFYQVLRARMRPVEAWPVQVQEFARKWDDFKSETGTIDFTDMIELALHDVDIAPGGPSIGMFDEVQDFTPLELALVRKWSKHMDYVLLAGDDDQAIYSFKGATPDAFLDPPIPDGQKRILNQSYRVPRQVQEFAQAWVEQLSRREPKMYRPRDEEGQVLRAGQGSWKRPESLIRDAEEHIAQGKTVMFLASCSYMLEPLKKLLREGGLPFHNPYRRRRGDWNPLHGGTDGGKYRRISSKDRVLAYLRPDRGVWGDHARMWTGDDLNLWVEVLNSRGILLHGGKKQAERLASRPGEVPITDLLTVFEEQALHNAMDLGLDWLQQHLLTARRRAMDFPIQVAKKRGGAALLEEPKIVIGTIHSVKGGQADIVYLFPDLSRSGMEDWITPGDRRDAVVRQFYVGMTRCREALVVCRPATGYRVPIWEQAPAGGGNGGG